MAELKAILQKAGAPSSGKTKADLIKAILASPAATAAVDGGGSATEDVPVVDEDLVRDPWDLTSLSSELILLMWFKLMPPEE